MSLPIQASPRAVVHLLNRAGFGPRPGQVKEVLTQGLEAYIKDQLHPTPDPYVERRLRPFRTLGLGVTEVLGIYHADAKKIPQIIDEFYTAKMIRAVHSKNQLQEALVDFWFNHFNVNLPDMFVRQAVSSYERDAIRPHVLGKFGDLLRATAAHPAMLYYLDNYLSKKNEEVDGKLVRGLNENYGRELLELHTLGVDAGYTQEHVVDASRCFTGWTLDDLKTGRFVFRAKDHDTGGKEVFGLKVPAGGGKEDADKLLDYLSVHPATGRFVSRKLARRFVADDPPESLVDSCAKTFVATGGDIPQVLHTLFTSREFWDEAGKPKLKTPVEYVFSALRASGARVRSATPGLTKRLAAMGMQPYFATPPTGYSNRGVDWVNPLYLHRLNFALDLAAGNVQGVTLDLLAVVKQAGASPEDPASVAQMFNREIFADGLSAQTLTSLSDPGPGTVPAVTRVAGLILASPEMQAR